MTKIRIKLKEEPTDDTQQLLRELRHNQYVEQGAAHKIWELLEKAAKKIESDTKTIYDLEKCIGEMDDIICRLEQRLRSEGV